MKWKPFEEAYFSHDYDEHLRILKAAGAEGGQLFRNNRYQVVRRPMEDGAVMLSIFRIDRAPSRDWRDFQRIKNELAGVEREAVEIYPAESRKVDMANQYYLWVLPVGTRVPWGFDERMLSERTYRQSRQRPFDDPFEHAEALRTDARVGEVLKDALERAGVPYKDVKSDFSFTEPDE